jgi:hypothetical protein
MRVFFAAVGLFALAESAVASPPASCVNKFAGEWLHNGNGGNRGTLTRDGRAICTENTFCQSEGTWTCEGNTMTYTTSLGSWLYTLMPDGSITANGGAARATRIGRKHDYGGAANVTADVLKIDRSEPLAPIAAPPPKVKPAAAQPAPVSDEARQAAINAAKFYGAGVDEARAAARQSNYANWSSAEDRFTEAAAQYRKAGDPAGERKSLEAARKIKAIYTRLPEPSMRHTAAARHKPAVNVMKDSLRCQKYQSIANQIDELKGDSTQVRADLRRHNCF